MSDDNIDSISSVDTIPSQPYRSPSRSIKGEKGLPKLPEIPDIAKEYRPYVPNKPEKLGGDRPREGPLVEDMPYMQRQPSIEEDLEVGPIEPIPKELKPKPKEPNDSYNKLLKLAYL